MNYFVDCKAAERGPHLVHRSGCEQAQKKQISLGRRPDADRAAWAARKYFEKAEACPACCRLLVE